MLALSEWQDSHEEGLTEVEGERHEKAHCVVGQDEASHCQILVDFFDPFPNDNLQVAQSRVYVNEAQASQHGVDASGECQLTQLQVPDVVTK